MTDAIGVTPPRRQSTRLRLVRSAVQSSARTSSTRSLPPDAHGAVVDVVGVSAPLPSQKRITKEPMLTASPNIMIIANLMRA